MDAEQLKQMKKLQREVDDANELAERFIQGYTNYDAEYVGNKLTKAKAALTDYLDSITEKPMTRNQAFEEPVFQLKASVQTYELSLADIAQLIAGQLGVPVSRLTITHNEREIGDGDRYSNKVFDGLTITVKNA